MAFTNLLRVESYTRSGSWGISSPMGVDPLIAPLRLAEAEAAKRPATGGYNELPSDRRSATAACFELARRYLVMGAYGRSRLHELMLGGVT